MGCKWCAQGDCWSHGGKGGARKGKGKGGGGGAWLPMHVIQQLMGGGGGGGKGRGKGKGKGKNDRSVEELRKITADCKVWIGGLAKGVTWKDLETHVAEVATKPSVTLANDKKGTGVCAFKTAEEATAAISAVNGTELKGSTLEADVWTKKEKKED